MAIRISTPVTKILAERGLLPNNCRNVDLSIPASGAMILTFECYVTDAHLDILAEAFTMQADLIRQAEIERQQRDAVRVETTP